MKYIIVTGPVGHEDTVRAVLENNDISQVWTEPRSDHDDCFTLRFISGTGDDQAVMDQLQKALASTTEASIHVLNVDTAYPQTVRPTRNNRVTRDELEQVAEQGCRRDRIYLLLVFMSTIVAAIGLVQDNVAVIIGAMVIAPLLGPNLSMALGFALGREDIVQRSLIAIAWGVVLVLLISTATGLLFDIVPGSEMEERTHSGFDSALLAFASGVAAVLSMTRGVQGALVGVMVAVALLPPLTVCGLYLGLGEFARSFAAFMLFLVNVSAIAFSALATLYITAVAPRTGASAAVARRSTRLSALGWLVVLVGLSYAASTEIWLLWLAYAGLG